MPLETGADVREDFRVHDVGRRLALGLVDNDRERQKDGELSTFQLERKLRFISRWCEHDVGGGLGLPMVVTLDKRSDRVRGSKASQDGVHSGAVGGDGKNLLKVTAEAGSNPTNQMVGPGC